MTQTSAWVAPFGRLPDPEYVLMSSVLEVTIGQHSTRGRKEINQDFYGLMLPKEPLRTTKGIAVAIADGISASEAGQVAAEACVTGFLEDYFCTPDSWSVKKSAEKVLTALNSWLYSQGRHYRDASRGFVSTLSALVIKSATAYLFHVGDTRIYRLRDNSLDLLTTDHKVWVSEEKNYLSRAMGVDMHLEIDYLKVPVTKGDIFVLTTDGVHEYVDSKTIIDLIADYSDDLNRAAQGIVQVAFDKGSPDNLTCQVVRIEKVPLQEADEVYQQLTELPFPPELEPGMILDGYRIARELHASKYTQIYLALDTETDNRVVLKTPSVNYEDDPVYLERFLLEEWIAKRINNPHVLKVCGQERRRHFLYYVTEYIEGQTLRQWINDHAPTELEEGRRIIEQIAKGLQAFHRMEMLHQDLKPENIMIDKVGTIKIIDFGSTRVAGIAEIATPIERMALLGTLNYTAPEYLLGQSGTNRSDIFSLGVISYELLTGQLPYGDSKATALPSLSSKSFRYTLATDHNRSLPRWVDGALRKAVHPDPKRRYAELSEFLFDLRHPNPEFVNEVHRPLLERNPVAFWRGLCIIQFLILVYLLLFVIFSS